MDIFAQYYEDLLKKQYEVSEMLVRDQHLSCGTIREDFLKEILLKRRTNIAIKKGFVQKGTKRSLECDHIYFHRDSPIDNLGAQCFIEPKYCKLILEIKSNATGADFKKTNENFATIKDIDEGCAPMCGLFCYNTDLTKKTILRRFGWVYDADIDSWVVDSSLGIEYPNIDFLINISCLDADEQLIDNQLFIIKDMTSGKFILRQEYPIIKNFFTVFDNL